MEDVSVELSVEIPDSSGKVMTKTILMWHGMVPVVGDQIDTENGPYRMRFCVVGRLWFHRVLTLICKPTKEYSVQTLADAGFAE